MDFKKKRWFIILFVAISYGAVWMFPYMLSTYYIPVQQAFGFTHKQLGSMMTAYGLVAAALYLPGGYIADRFGIKQLIGFSYLGTAALGMCMLFIPPLPVMLAIQFGFGITTIFTFWSAIMKFVRIMGDRDEQGKMYGLFFSISGAFATIVGFAASGLYGALGENVYAFKSLIVLFAAVIALPTIGFLLLFNEKEAYADTSGEDSQINFGDVGKVLKMPIVWIMALAVFLAYIPKSIQVYSQPYMEYFSVPVVWISVIAIVRSYVIRLLVTPFAGWLRDKMGVGSSPKVVRIGFIIGIVALATILLTPVNPGLSFMIITSVLLISMVYQFSIACSFVPISEAGISHKLTGTIVGFVSCIGYSADAWFYLVAGGVIDANGFNGYRILFAVGLISCLLGVVITYVLKKSIEKTKAKNEAIASGLAAEALVSNS